MSGESYNGNRISYEERVHTVRDSVFGANVYANIKFYFEMKIDVLELIKWLSLGIALALFAWWLFGNSPSIEQIIAIGFPLVFFFMALEGRISSTIMRREIRQAHSEQTKVLNKIYDLLEKRG